MKVYKECCKNCLLSADAIVSAKRRKEIIQTCSQEQSHFICHKASMRGDDICCKTFYEKLGHTSQLVRIAQRLNAVQFVEQPESEKLPSHREMSVGKNERYLILDKTNKVVAEKATLEESELYVKARPYLKYEKFDPLTESVACDLDDIL